MKIDFHVHTSFSDDAISSPKEVVKAALKKKLNGICITDHDQIKGAAEVLKLAFDLPILIIPGIEITSKEGDILGINVKKIISRGLSAKETIKAIKKAGGLAVIAHPFAWPIVVNRFSGRIEELLGLDPGIEALNGSLFNFSNRKAFELAKKFDLFYTAGSDAHSANCLGAAFTEIPEENLSAEEVLEEIKKKNVKLKRERVIFFENLKTLLKRELRDLFFKF